MTGYYLDGRFYELDSEEIMDFIHGDKPFDFMAWNVDDPYNPDSLFSSYREKIRKALIEDGLNPDDYMKDEVKVEGESLDSIFDDDENEFITLDEMVDDEDFDENEYDLIVSHCISYQTECRDYVSLEAPLVRLNGLEVTNDNI